MFAKARIIDKIIGRDKNGIFRVDGGKNIFRHPIIGEVEVIQNGPSGNRTLFTKKIHYNDLLVNGAVYFSEKINNFRSSFAPTPLDVDLGVHALSDIVRDNTTIKDEIVIGLVAGVGGSTDTYNQIHPVQRHHKCVPNIIPFRVVDTTNDLTNSDQTKYFLKSEKVIGGRKCYAYYGKKFESTGEIKVMFEDGTDVPTNVDALIDPKFIKTYSEYTCLVDQRDIREWFKLTAGSTKTSRINSVGLVTGYPILVSSGVGNVDQFGNPIQDVYEYGNVRCITTLNMENKDLKDDTSTITFVYRLIIL